MISPATRLKRWLFSVKLWLKITLRVRLLLLSVQLRGDACRAAGLLICRFDCLQKIRLMRWLARWMTPQINDFYQHSAALLNRRNRIVRMIVTKTRPQRGRRLCH